MNTQHCNRPRRLYTTLAVIGMMSFLPQSLLVFAGAAQAASAQQSSPAVAATLAEAEIALKTGRLDEALTKCRETLKVHPESARAYYLIGIIALQRGEQDEAKKALLQSIRLNPSVIATHMDLGKVYFASKQWSAAELGFRQLASWGMPLAILSSDWDWRWLESRGLRKLSHIWLRRSEWVQEIRKAFLQGSLP